MTGEPQALTAAGIGCIAFLMLCLLSVLCFGLVWLAVVVEGLPDPNVVLEAFVDQQVESGLHAPGLDPQEPLLAARTMLLTHELNERSAGQIVSRLLYLNHVDPQRPIELYISTPGGWVDETFAIVDAMNLIDAPVNTWCIGGCYSSGAVLLAAGTGRRYATQNAIIMVHTNRRDSTKAYSYERLELDRFESLWRRSARLPEPWFPMTSGNAYYLSASEALKFGIIDEIATMEGVGDDKSQ